METSKPASSLFTAPYGLSNSPQAAQHLSGRAHLAGAHQDRRGPRHVLPSQIRPCASATERTGTLQQAPRQVVNAKSSAPAGRMILVDALALLYRAHFGFAKGRLASKGGEDTSIAFGFVRAVLDLLELDPPPTHFAVVFDACGKTFRHELYQGYKGQRPPMPDEITTAMPRISALLQGMGLAELGVAGVEADDVIATLATRAVREGFHVAIASPDKDYNQLLGGGLQLLRPRTERSQPPLVSGWVPYNAAAFQEDFGVSPQQYVDVLALSGDASDNVRGVKGIGAKGAPELIRQFGSLDALLERASEVKRKAQREELMSAEGQAAARLSRRLVKLQKDLDLPPVRVPLDEFRIRTLTLLETRQLEELFRELDFRTHADRWRSAAAHLSRNS